MAINKVNYGDRTLIDLTDSTLTSSDELVEGVTAYDRSGNRITGTADFMDKVDNPTADKILIDDGNGQAQDSSVSIIDVALMSDVNGKQDVLTAGTGIDISNNVISNQFTQLSGVDLDNVDYNFQGYVLNATNNPTNPSGTASGIFLCFQRKGSTADDRAVQYFTTLTNNVTYTRTINSSSWTAWRPLTMTAGTGISIADNGTIINRFANLSNVDLNTIRYNCQAYAGDSCTNKPTTNGGMFICTMGSNNGTYGAQLFITYATTNQGVYYRRFNGSATPTAWRKLSDCYEAGDTFTISSSEYVTVTGYCIVTSNSNLIRFFLPLSKPISASTITVSSMVLYVLTSSSNNAWKLNGVNVISTSGYSLSARKQQNGILFNLTCPSSVSLTNRDTAMVLFGATTINFS